MQEPSQGTPIVLLVFQNNWDSVFLYTSDIDESTTFEVETDKWVSTKAETETSNLDGFTFFFNVSTNSHKHFRALTFSNFRLLWFFPRTIGSILPRPKRVLRPWKPGPRLAQMALATCLKAPLLVYTQTSFPFQQQVCLCLIGYLSQECDSK